MQPDDLINERYALEEPIGHGGMAEVWRAHDQRLERTVAVKFLATGSADNPEFLARLFHEAQSVAAISHPNVVEVLDYGTTPTGPYLVMEYVPGGSLAGLTGTPLPPDRAVEIVRQVAAGAGAAHAKGIVHRDIKPGNILLCDDGSVKLADFGIASSEVATNLTATGAAIGSPHYISPEQAMGERATPRADVYAMGVVLYELLCGRLPFDGGNATAIAISHVEEAAEPPSALLPELDPQLDALVMRCLAKQPEERFEDGNALGAALDDPSFATAAIAFPDEEDTASFASTSGAGASWAAASWARVMAGDGQMGATRASVLKKAAAALVILVLLVAIGIHLMSQPGGAEPRRPKQASSSQPAHHKKGLSSVTSSPSTTPTTVTVSSSPTTTQPQNPHKSPKPNHPTSSTSVTAATTSTSAPSTTSSTTTTSTPSPTPTAAATAAAL